MPENPAIGAAAGFASDAARNYESGLDFVTRLRAAAQQQQQHDDMLRQESFKNALELAGKGAVPLTQDPTGGTIAKGGLGVRTADNPAAAGVTGMTVTAPSGRQFKIPDANQKAADKLTDANSFTLTDKLAKQAGALGESMIVGQRYPLSMAEHVNAAIDRENAAAERKSEFQQRDKERLDTESEREKDRQDARTESARRYAQTEKDRQDARTESQRRYEETRADRAQRLAESQQAAQDRKEAKEQAARDRAQVLIDKYQKDEHVQHDIRGQYGDLLSAKKGDVVTDPKSKTKVKIGEHPELDAARRQVWTREYQTATDQVQRLQDTQKKLIARMGGETEPAAAAAPAAQPAPAKPAPPVGTVSKGYRFKGGDASKPESWAKVGE